ncbi:hypothetical protein PACTADRAFT_77773 [Pachysolen tannophilus NRRL Y-2460]|uniref:ER lumen protein-retaining receptor n=1 Tax=Pachysolen tannophilus NRRL Y-2460 TaxID=669874 RepID=A0A1E4TNV2_PACTA|nr:hypothetical protein PACTADRAFT_77773 [Pachysolen tannophilus NRRL Y-2460]
MNIFRILGDLSHLTSIIILLHTINTNKSTTGISLKTQILYVIVFITRYLDLFTKFISVYNTLMKIFFIISSVYIVYLIQYKYSQKHMVKQDLDNFKVEYLLAGSLLASLIFNYKFTPLEILWSFSLWLESVAILPQLMMLTRTGEADMLTTNYIFCLGLYRAFYIPNWFYRYFAEGHFDKLAVFTGLIQTLLYSDFFYIYYKNVIQARSSKLPV